MISQCHICKRNVMIKKFKGMSKAYIMCSFECFIKTCESVGGPFALPDNVTMKKNKMPKIYRSALEENFAKFLTDNRIEFKFEPYIFVYKNGNKTKYYLPDFYLPNYEIFIETKGDLWGSGAYPKFKIFLQFIPLLLINNGLFKLIKNKLGSEFILKGEIHGNKNVVEGNQ